MRGVNAPYKGFRFSVVLLAFAVTACVSKDRISSVTAFSIREERKLVTCFEDKGEWHYWGEGARRKFTFEMAGRSSNLPHQPMQAVICMTFRYLAVSRSASLQPNPPPRLN